MPSAYRNTRHHDKWISNQKYAIFVICVEYCGIMTSPLVTMLHEFGSRLVRCYETVSTFLLLENGEGYTQILVMAG